MNKEIKLQINLPFTQELSNKTSESFDDLLTTNMNFLLWEIMTIIFE